jgi:uncharacterized membrane protein YkvA (DUF1232 family)
MAEERRNLLGPYIPEGNFIREAVQQLKLVYNLMLDERVPLLTKVIPIASLAYLFMPIDLVPDFALGLGQLDDLAIVMMGMRFFLEFAPAEVVHEHLKRLTQHIPWNVKEAPPPSSTASAGEDVVDADYQADDNK